VGVAVVMKDQRLQLSIRQGEKEGYWTSFFWRQGEKEGMEASMEMQVAAGGPASDLH
jgi:hypothetical protein